MATADIVDNSISARVKIDIWFHWDGADSWLTIADDGHGMNEAEMVEAMRPGSLEHASQLLENMPDDTAPALVVGASDEKTSPPSISLEEIQKAVAWDKRHKVLEIRHHVQLKEIAEGRKKLNTYNLPSVNYLIRKLTSRGFSSDN